jgi:hypothetical protein
VQIGAQQPDLEKSPNGIAFSEFRGYETWESVATS